MLKRLSLNYFKKHEKLEVDFTEGLNGITGPNYKGKSTILLGILFCLGGSRMVPGTRIATRGTNAGFKQTLWFEIPGKGGYMVQRTKTSANLHRITDDGVITLVASGTTPVNNAIAELLGMPLRRFAQIKYAKQKAADAILKAGSGELFKIVTELTGLERIVTVLGMLDNDIKVHRHVLEVTPSVDLEPREAELGVLRTDLKAATTLRTTISEELSKCAEELDLAEQEERRHSKTRSILYDAQRELRYAVQSFLDFEAHEEKLSERFAEVNAEAIGLNDGLDISIDVPLEQWAAKRKALAVQEQAARELFTEVATLTREAASLQATEDELRQASQSVLRSLEMTEVVEEEVRLQAEQDLAAAIQKRPDALHRLKHAEAALDGGACSSCERPFEDFNEVAARQEVADARHTVDLLLQEIEERVALAEGLTKKQRMWQRAATELDKRKAALADFQAHADKLRHRLAEQSLKMADMPSPDHLKQELAKADNHLASLQRIKSEIVRLAAESAEASKHTANADAHRLTLVLRYEALLQEHGMQGPEEAEARLEKVQQIIDELRKLQVSITTNLDKARELVAQLTTKIRLLEQEVATGKANNSKHEEARCKVLAMEQLRDLIRSNRDRYSKQVWNVFMASATLFTSSITGGYMESVSRDSDGAFTFFEEGHEMSLDEASGAQQAIIGCAVQMALAEAAQCPLDVILMDEPTADMDPEHALAFSTLLAASGKQVIMVSHRELDASVFNHSISL